MAPVLLSNESIWLTHKRMAELFGVGVAAISKHLDNIYESGELQREATVSILETVQQEKLNAEQLKTCTRSPAQQALPSV